MRHGFYPQIAWNGIRRNKKLYIPYILTCIGMIMMTYIIRFLGLSDVLYSMRGGSVMMSLLNFGYYIIAIFSLIFLFYTSSFLNRRRDKEFGLYNILGMGKKNLTRILLWEALMIAAIAMVAGIAAGILLSKLAELGMINLLHGDVDFTLRLTAGPIIDTLEVFLVIFAVIFANTLRLMWQSRPIELLHSEHMGEKPPRDNWVLAVLGALLLAGAYYIALTIQDPVEAMLWFFVAVVMVILATYFLFIAGSVLLCRILQRNKGYYYKKQHFVSLSSMVYRMKRNGAGLASICILCTMVLVMLSSTVCLYIGAEDSLSVMYPRDIYLRANVAGAHALLTEDFDAIRGMCDEIIHDYGQTPENIREYRMASATVCREDDQLMTDRAGWESAGGEADDICMVYLLPLDSYTLLTGEEAQLASGEALIGVQGDVPDMETLTIDGRVTFKIKQQAASMEKVNVNGVVLSNLNEIYLFVPDFGQILTALEDEPDADGIYTWNYTWWYGFDLSCGTGTQIEIYEKLDAAVGAALFPQSSAFEMLSVRGSAESSEEFYAMYGGLFFLGILLGVVFVFAAVLIMYYKQITEGYEDQSRFDIMQKVGMTRREIRQSINSQILTVFFAPLMMAGLHLIFAFPMLYKMLQAFGLQNMPLLMLVTLGCFLAFAVFYIIVYRVTSGAYYHIVSGIRRADAR